MSGGAYVVRLFRPLPAAEAISLARSLDANPEIEYAEPDLLRQPVLVPNDSRYVDQWHCKSPPAEPGGVNLPPAWDITTGSASVVAAVIDTGSLPSHPDLAGRYVGGYDFISDIHVANDGDGRDSDPSDPGDWVTAAETAVGQYFYGCAASNSSFHGAHVAGTIGAATNNATGVAGINWVGKICRYACLASAEATYRTSPMRFAGRPACRFPGYRPIRTRRGCSISASAGMPAIRTG